MIERSESANSVDESSTCLGLALFLFQRIRYVLIGAVIAETLLVIFWLTCQREYAARAVIEVPSPNIVLSDGARIVVLPAIEILSARIAEHYDVYGKMSSANRLPRLDKVQKSSSLLVLTSAGRTPEEAKEYLAKVADEVVADISKPLNAAVKSLSFQMDELRRFIEELEKNIGTGIPAMGSGEPPRVEAQAESPTRVLSSFSQTNALASVLRIQGQLTEYQMNYVAMQQNKVQMVVPAESILDGKPVRPSLALYIIFALALGLGFGVAFAFLAEFISQVNKRLRM